MLFYSPLFLFIFFPLVLILYFSQNQVQIRNTILLSASLFFYFWGEPRFLPIAILSTVVDFFIGHYIFKNRKKVGSRYFLFLGICFNVLLLIYYKYADFLVGNFNYFFSKLSLPTLPLLHILLPIGVSFIVFEKITYLVDIYRGKGEPAKSLPTYLLYIFLFPKLLAGPIVKYHDIENQLTHHNFNQADFLEGFKRFLIGLIKKILLADTVGELANTVFNLPNPQLGFFQAWIGIICFTLQIYLDFSAYSDMDIGLARIFGFKLLENFNMPYTATSFTDFWHRWHISLSTWIREYLYYPLGGNRKGNIRTYFNLWCCFLLSGLWHGAHWTFVLWGAYHGLFLILDKLFWLRLSAKLPKYIKISTTLFFIVCGWVIFRCDSFSQMTEFFKAMLNPNHQGQELYITLNIWIALLIGLLISMVPIVPSYNKLATAWFSFRPALFIENWAMSLLAIFAIIRIMSMTFNPFLYFRF